MPLATRGCGFVFWVFGWVWLWSFSGIVVVSVTCGFSWDLGFPMGLV